MESALTPEDRQCIGTPRSSAICFPMVVPLDLGDLLLSGLVISIDAFLHLYMDSRTFSVILPYCLSRGDCSDAQR